MILVGCQATESPVIQRESLEKTEETLIFERDTLRKSDVNTILFSVWQFAQDHGTQLPFQIIPEQEMEICKHNASQCDGMVQMEKELLNPNKYLTELPADPLSAEDTNGTRYFIKVSSDGRITVSAPDAEGDQEISNTR